MNKERLDRCNELVTLISMYKEKLINLQSKKDELLIGYRTDDGDYGYIGIIEDIRHTIVGSNIPSTNFKSLYNTVENEILYIIKKLEKELEEL